MNDLRQQNIALFWKYRVVREIQQDPELGQYFTYGLKAELETEFGFEQVELAHDVTTDCRLAQEIADRFTFCQLSPIHLKEAIEDCLP